MAVQKASQHNPALGQVLIAICVNVNSGDAHFKVTKNSIEALTARQYHGQGVLEFHAILVANIGNFFTSYQDVDDLQTLISTSQVTKLLIKQILHPSS